jgi:hypothetical protein
LAILFVFIAFIVVVVAAGSASPTRAYDRLVASGVKGRGILLQVSPQPLRTVGTPRRRFQLRKVQIDVEVPGKAPYVIDATPYIPTNLVRDVLPGATVELRIDRSDRSKIAIIGPGVGFAGAAQLMAAPVASNGDGGAR